MNNEQFPIKRNVHKTKRVVIILSVFILYIVTVSAIIYYFLFPVLLLGGLFDNPPSKNRVMQTLYDNKITFDDAVDYIKTLDSKIYRIDNESKGYSSNGDEFNIDDESSSPKYNETVKKIFKHGIKSISINDNSIDFFCGGAGRDYYTGIVYSYNGNPVGFHGDTTMTLIKKGNGWEWKEDNGDNHYYCEKIEGNWYYYQMWY